MEQLIPINWEVLIRDNNKISILVDNPLPQRIGEGKESYVGKVVGYKNGFIQLLTPDNVRIEAIVIKEEMIVSIWLYREKY